MSEAGHHEASGHGDEKKEGGGKEVEDADPFMVFSEEPTGGPPILRQKMVLKGF